VKSIMSVVGGPYYYNNSHHFQSGLYNTPTKMQQIHELTWPKWLPRHHRLNQFKHFHQSVVNVNIIDSIGLLLWWWLHQTEQCLLPKDATISTVDIFDGVKMQKKWWTMSFPWVPRMFYCELMSCITCSEAGLNVVMDHCPTIKYCQLKSTK